MGELSVNFKNKPIESLIAELTAKLRDAGNKQMVATIGLDEIFKITGKTGVIVLFDRNQPEYLPSSLTPEGWENLLITPEVFLEKAGLSSLETGKILTRSSGLLGELSLIPLARRWHVLGIMVLKGSPENEQEEDLLLQIGNTLGDYFHRINNVVKPHHIYEILGDAFVKILGSLDRNMQLNEAQFEIASAIQEAFVCDIVAIVFPEPENVFVKKILFKGEKNWHYQVNKQINQGILNRSIQEMDLLLINDPAQSPDFDEDMDGIDGEEISSLMCLPLTYLGKLQAIVQLIRLKGAYFSPEEKISLQSSAGFIASIFYNTAQSYFLRVVNAELEASGWELTRSRNTLRALFDHMPYSVYIIDQDYRLNAVNMARCRRAGEDPRILNGKVCYRVLFGYSEPCPDCLVSDTLVTGKATHRKKLMEEESEEQIEWEIDTYPIFNEEGLVVQAILFEQDVTESRRLEMILAQSEKLAAIGQLAAGVAHEINNPLTVILANTQILLKELPANEDWIEALDLIEKASVRAQQVVRNMLGLARKEEYEFVPVNVNDNIQRSLQLIRHELLVRSVELEFIPAVDMPDILASEDHLQGVWMNIILNAIDATENTPNARVEIKTMHDETGVRVMIYDNGHGIPADKIKRIFEPFYTTRGPGRQTGGTGLGLSVCHRIVRQHGGEIFVDSKVGVGTTFIVILPLIRIMQ